MLIYKDLNVLIPTGMQISSVCCKKVTHRIGEKPAFMGNGQPKFKFVETKFQFKHFQTGTKTAQIKYHRNPLKTERNRIMPLTGFSPSLP